MAIIVENLVINNKNFIKTYSNLGMMIERDGIRYAEAVDPVEFNRQYMETDQPINSTEEDNKEISAEEFQAMLEEVL